MRLGDEEGRVDTPTPCFVGPTPHRRALVSVESTTIARGHTVIVNEVARIVHLTLLPGNFSGGHDRCQLMSVVRYLPNSAMLG